MIAVMPWKKIETVLPTGDFVAQIKVGSKKICILRHQGVLHATQIYCPHAGGVLSGGWCKNNHLVCPIHRYEYDLETGRGAPGQGDYITVFQVEERKDGVYVLLKDSFWNKLFS